MVTINKIDTEYTQKQMLGISTFHYQKATKY